MGFRKFGVRCGTNEWNGEKKCVLLLLVEMTGWFVGIGIFAGNIIAK
jgi:hypothetical protein